jgi:hypothetical protein
MLLLDIFSLFHHFFSLIIVSYSCYLNGYENSYLRLIMRIEKKLRSWFLVVFDPPSPPPPGGAIMDKRLHASQGEDRIRER